MNDTLYREEILDHYHYPKNSGKPRQFDCTHKEANTHCGDEIEVFLTLKGQTLTGINYVAKGCAISVASASILSEKLINRRKKDILKLTTKDVLELLKLDLTPVRAACALLPMEAIKRALT